MNEQKKGETLNATSSAVLEHEENKSISELMTHYHRKWEIYQAYTNKALTNIDNLSECNINLAMELEKTYEEIAKQKASNKEIAERI